MPVDYVTWIVLGVVAAILIGNLLKLLPRGMLHTQHLREEARKLGYRVERQPELEPDDQLYRCVGYRQSLERCPVPQEFSCVREGEGWSWLLGDQGSASVQDLLQALPAEVKRIDRQSFSVLVYWVEPKSVDVLLKLDEALAPLRKADSN